MKLIDYLVLGLYGGGSVAEPVAPVNTALPVITGVAQDGETLTGSDGSWTGSPTSFTYLWLADDVPIGGAVANTLLLTSLEVDALITFEVTATNAIGTGDPATSAPTTAVVQVNFYVDATLGDDADPGTQALPWQTIAKVNAATFTPGDSILFKAGEVWREKLSAPSSGALGNPIIIDKYGAGALPEINGADLVTTWSAVPPAVVLDTSFVYAATSGEGCRKVTGTTYLAQGIQTSASGSGTVDHVTLFLKRVAAPTGNIWVEIWIDTGANEPGAVIANGVSDVVDASTIATTYGNVTFAWTTPPTLSADTLYFLVVRGDYTVSATNYIEWGVNFGGGYLAGRPHCKFYDANGVTWTVDTGRDHVFGVYLNETLTNVWQATFTKAAAPKKIFLDGAQGTAQASLAAVTSALDWYWAANVLYVYSTSDPDTAFTSPGIEATRREPSVELDVSYITLRNIHVTHADLNGIENYSEAGITTTGNIIEDCVVDYNGWNGIYGGWNASNQANNWIVRRNQLNYNGVTLNLHHGVYVKNSDGWLIEDNSAVGNMGYAYQLNDDANNNIIRRNFSKANLSGGVVLYDDGAGGSDNNQVYDNVSVGDRDGLMVGGSVNNSGNVAYNNTFYGFTRYGIYTAQNSPVGVFKNNILYSEAVGAKALYDEGGSATLTSDYNLIGAEATGFIHWNGSDYDTLADFQAGEAQDAHSISADPLFTDAATDDFTLTGYSPAINAGADVGLTEDYAGNAVPYVGAMSVVDIGAYEYQGDLTAPVAGFSVATLTGDAPFTIQIIDASVGAVAWAYEFGVEGTSEEQNPQYTFTVPGTYSIRQTVFNVGFASDFLLRTAYITVTAAAVPGVPANLSAGATNGVVIDRTPTYTADVVAIAVTYDFQRNTAADETGATLFAGNATPQYTELTNLPLVDHFVRVRASNGDGDGAWSSWLGFTVVLAETVMTQSLGAELLANPDFTTWASAHPSSWSRAGEVASDPLISEVAAGGGAGTGAAKFYSSATLNVPTVSQTVLTIGGYIERVLVLSQRTSGIARLYDGAPTASRPQGLTDPTAAATYRIIDKNTSTSFRAGGLSSAPIDLVVDSVSAKVLTPNATFIVGADGVFQVNYTLPPTPDYREMIMLQFRAGDDSGQADWLNHWRVLVYYTGSAWNARLEKVVAGTVTNVKAQAGIGANDSLRVTVSGNDITATWGLAGTYSGISTAASDAALNTNTRARVIYTSHFSAVALFAGADAADFPIYTGTAWHVDQTSIVTPPTGSAAAPFISLKAALENAALVSGDQVILHGVVLVDNETVNFNANGITIKPPDGEYNRIHLDNAAWIYTNGDDNFWLEVDIDGIDADRTSAQAGSSPSDIGRQGFYFYGQRNTVRNRMITNVKNSGTACYNGAGLRVYGGVVSHNGWYSTPDAAYHGHNHYYVQNDPAADTITYEQTIVANGFNDNGKIGGTAAAENSNITVQDVIYIDGEIYCSWASAAQGIVFQRLDGWNWRINIPVVVTPQHSFSLIDCVTSSAGVPLFMRGILALTMTGNKFARRGSWLIVRSVDTDAQVIVALTSNNNAYRTDTVQDVKLQTATASRTLAAWQAAIGQDAASTAQSSAKLPDSVTVTQIGSLDRCLVSIHNENALATSVNAPLTGILTNGVSYIARQGQDCRGDTFTFTFNSGVGADNGDGTVSFDMTAVGHSVATPIGLTAFHTTSFPYFGSFYVEPNLPTP